MYIYVRNPDSNDSGKDTYVVGLTEQKDFRTSRRGCDKCKEYTFTTEQFHKYAANKQLKYVRIVAENNEELRQLAEVLSDTNIYNIWPGIDPYKNFDLSPLVLLNNTASISIYYNLKITKLWDMSKNRRLECFRLSDCNHVSDFSCLMHSNIEELTLTGCNYLSSFTSKLHIDDLSFLFEMPKLKDLALDIVKDQSDAYYLKTFSKLTNLRVLTLPDGFFTFEQYAWLAAHLPGVEGLEPYREVYDTYCIIGYRKPRELTDMKKVKQYEQQYNELMAMYKDCDIPPEKQCKK